MKKIILKIINRNDLINKLAKCIDGTVFVVNDLMLPGLKFFFLFGQICTSVIILNFIYFIFSK